MMHPTQAAKMLSPFQKEKGPTYGILPATVKPQYSKVMRDIKISITHGKRSLTLQFSGVKSTPTLGLQIDYISFNHPDFERGKLPTFQLFPTRTTGQIPTDSD